MDYCVDLTVYGVPGPQGSKKDVGVRIAKSGRPTAIMVESSAKVKKWRRLVAAAADEARPAELLDGPLAAHIVFTMPRPASHYGTGRNAGVLKPRYRDARPFRLPDASKLLRATEDALTGIVWVDDARLVEFDRLAKVYVHDPADPDVLDEPGAIIRVRPFAPRSHEQLPNVRGDVRGDVPLFVLNTPEGGPR